MRDPELRYLQALRLVKLPNGRLRIFLDTLPTVIGHADEPIPIQASVLLRGVAGELLERTQEELLELRVSHRGEGRRLARKLRALERGLEPILKRIDEGESDLKKIRRLLRELKPRRWLLWLLLSLLALLLLSTPLFL